VEEVNGGYAQAIKYVAAGLGDLWKDIKALGKAA
jgi:hypothetical protein